MPVRRKGVVDVRNGVPFYFGRDIALSKSAEEE
jgi:hypothetical protein